MATTTIVDDTMTQDNPYATPKWYGCAFTIC